jgi:drug/metabolite transporter (DMT)-like permease
MKFPAAHIMRHDANHLPAVAIGMVVASAACFTAIDTIVKYLGARYSVPLLVWVRWGVPALLMVALLGPKMRWGLLRSANPKLQVIRGAVLICSSLCFFAALKFLPLAEATGLNYSTPILVILMASLFLRERVTRSRWIFVVAGFVGTIFILRPGGATLHAASLFALGGAALNATFQILTRKLAQEDLMVLIFYPSLVGAVLMAFAVPFFADVAFMNSDILLFIAIGILGGVGHFLFVRAFQRAPASTIAPFTYMQLVWSTLAGWMMFGAFPDRWALAGITLIAASGMVLACYERWRAGIAQAARTDNEPRPSPILMSIPGAGVMEIASHGHPDALAAGVFQFGVGESIAVSYGAGPPKTVVRTD